MSTAQRARHLRFSGLGLAAAFAATAFACSSSSSTSAGNPGSTPPSGATPFTVPASGWTFAKTCSGAEYVVYVKSGCTQNAYVLCEQGEWADILCASSPPSGYAPSTYQLDSGTGYDSGDNSYPACAGTTCTACADLQSCCAYGSLPNAGVCDHTGWNEAVCESLLNKYTSLCGETCHAGVCASSSTDGGSADASSSTGG